MQERRRIVDLWKRGSAAVLITLVRVEGSSYRKPGARLLVTSNGDYAGAISGGCLEADMLRQAQWKVRSGAVLERYSTLFDDTADIPYGLGCGGTVEVLLEPATTPEFTALMQAMEASLASETRRVITSFLQGGHQVVRSVLDIDRRRVFSSGPRDTHSADPLYDEWLEPPQRLVVLGAGDDARPLVQFAAMLGWNVVVVDGRAHLARRERFPEAGQVTVSADAVKLSSLDAVAILTHSYEQDRAWLVRALPHSPRYLGLLGARHRSALLISEAATMLGWDVERACNAVFAPMGFDLGGDGAQVIALATIAEIQACIEGKLVAPRRMSVETVREQIALGGASRYLQTQCAL